MFIVFKGKGPLQRCVVRSSDRICRELDEREVEEEKIELPCCGRLDIETEVFALVAPDTHWTTEADVKPESNTSQRKGAADDESYDCEKACSSTWIGLV